MIDTQARGRNPTRVEDYDFHTRTLAGERVGMNEQTPQPGWYLRYSGRKNDKAAEPPVPAEIYYEAETDDTGHLVNPRKLVCVIGGRRVNPYKEWTWLAKNPISQSHYMLLIENSMEEGF